MKGMKIRGNLKVKMNGRSFQLRPKIMSLTCHDYLELAIRIAR